MVAVAPTAWCAAHLRLDSPTEAVLQETSAVFVQLQSISVCGDVSIDDIVALTAMPASLNQHTLREIEFGDGIYVTDDFMVHGLATVAARLETLIIVSGECVTDAGLASLCGTPMIATLRKFSLTGSGHITDAGVAAVLSPASQLRSLSLTQCTLLTGAFLNQLHENCHDSLAEIDLSNCDSIDNAGAAALCSLRGLTELGLSFAPQLSVLPLERLTTLRAVRSGFLHRCSALKTLDLSGLTGVASAGYHFLAWCHDLTTLDLSGLTHVAIVGDWFLYGCSGLRTLDLTALTNVAHVGDYFMRGCSGLTTLDLAPLSNVTSVGRNFLFECGGLTTLRLSASLLQHGSVLDEHKQLHARSSAAFSQAAAACAAY